jgi:hypothetical protein
VGGVIAVGLGVNLYLSLRPEALEARVRSTLAELFAAPFTVSRCSFSLSRGVEVEKLELRSRDGAAVVVAIDSLRVRPKLLPLLWGSFVPRRVLLDGVSLDLARMREGDWNLAHLLRVSPGEPTAGPPADIELPEVVVTRAQVRYSDEHTFSRPVTAQLDELRWSLLSHREAGVFSLDAEASGPLVRRLAVSGRMAVRGDSFDVDVGLRAFKVDLAAACAGFLPAELAREAASCGIEGQMDVQADLRYDREHGFVPLRIAGRLLRCGFSPPGVPFRVEGLSGDVHVRERLVELRGVQGRCADGLLALDGRVELGGGALTGESFSVAAWTAKVELRSFSVDGGAGGQVSGELQEFLREYSLRGRVSLSVEVPWVRDWPLRPHDVVATLRLEGVDCRPPEFPYLIEDLRGEVVLRDGRIVLDGPVEGRSGDGRFAALASSFADCQPGGAFDFFLRVGGARMEEAVQLDERLRNALPSVAWPIWDELRPGGWGWAEVEIRREPAPAPKAATSSTGPEVQVLVHAHAVDGSIHYRGFPYEVRSIRGELHVDSLAGRVVIQDFSGFHGKQEVRADGVVEFAEGERFRIDLRSPRLEVDEDLLRALPQEGRDLIAEFGFQGNIAAGVSVFSLPDGAVDIAAAFELLEGRLQPARFPYGFELGSGRLELSGGSTARLVDWKTSEGFTPKVTFNGSVTAKGPERHLEYDFKVQGLKVDDKLVAALPSHLREFVVKFGLKGTFDGDFLGWYAFDPQDPARDRIHYEGKNLQSHDAEVDFGLKVRSMDARGRFFGGHSPTRPDHFWGDVFVQSAWFNRLHLTRGDIHFSFGEPHMHVAADAKGQEVAGREYRLPEEFVRRLKEAKLVRDTFQMSVHSDDLYGGGVDGFVYVDTGTAGDIAGDFVAQGLKVAEASGDVFAVEARDVTGTASGRVRFEGVVGDARSLRGEGTGLIQEARLVELPLFFGLFSLLRLNFKDAAGRTFFTDLSLPYRIEEGHFVSNEIEIRSPGIRLLGGGKMSFDGGLDLTLRPYFLGVKIPLLEEVVGFIKDTLSRILVKGDLARPKVEFATAGGLLKIPIEQSKVPSEDARLPSDLRAKP